MKQTTNAPKIQAARMTVLIKEYYSVVEVSDLLGVSERTLRDLAHREDDPLPFRLLAGQQRNCFIHREDLLHWLDDNSCLVRDARRA